MWVPPNVARELAEGREQFNAELGERLSQHRALEVMQEFNRELQRIDPLLELMFVPDRADVSGTPLRRGFWHVLRRNEGAPWLVIPVEDEHGNPAEPSSRLFERLRQGDMWNARSQRERARLEREAQLAAERQKAREREARQDEIVERVAAATRTQVSMNRDTPWTQNISKASQRARGDKKRAEG